MKLKFTRKTWYFFLLAAAAMSMLGGFAVLPPRISAATRWCSCC